MSCDRNKVASIINSTVKATIINGHLVDVCPRCLIRGLLETAIINEVFNTVDSDDSLTDADEAFEILVEQMREPITNTVNKVLRQIDNNETKIEDVNFGTNGFTH